MEFRKWYFYLVINCVVIIPGLVAKPFSINKAIAAERKGKHQDLDQSQSKLSETTAQRFSLNKILRTDALKAKKKKITESLISSRYPEIFDRKSRGKKFLISPLKLEKKLHIKSPLTSKNLKYIQKPRLKRKNHLNKPDITENEEFNKKYLPLLKSLSMLFDDILKSDSTGSLEIRRKHNGPKDDSQERSEVQCSCAKKSRSKTNSQTTEKTITAATTTSASSSIDIETIQATASPAYITATSNISPFRQDQDLSILLARDTTSFRGNNIGLGEGSGTTFHRSNKRNITRDHGDSKLYTGNGEIVARSKVDEKDPDSNTRDGARSNELRRRVCRDRVDTRHPVFRRTSVEIEDDFSECENPIGSSGGNTAEDKHETEGNKTKGTAVVPEFVRGLARYSPKDQDVDSESIQSQKSDEESSINSDSYDKGFLVRDNTFSKENQEATSQADGRIINFKYTLNPNEVLHKSPKYKTPYVTIIDGYSVASNKNGKNKLSEQSVRLHSN